MLGAPRKVIPHAFRERSVSKVMNAALIRAAKGWRQIKMSQFELCLKANRDELDRAHAEGTAPVVNANSFPTRLSRVMMCHQPVTIRRRKWQCRHNAEDFARELEDVRGRSPPHGPSIVPRSIERLGNRLHRADQT